MDLQRIIDHYIKARVKHPKFADVLCLNEEPHKTKKFLEYLQKRNDTDDKKNAISILLEEVEEIKVAYNDNERKHAIDECYDAIAVLLRMIEFIENE